MAVDSPSFRQKPVGWNVMVFLTGLFTIGIRLTTQLSEVHHEQINYQKEKEKKRRQKSACQKDRRSEIKEQ